MSNVKRSSRLLMTDEARVLKELRLQHGLYMRKAANLIGLSDSYIAHIETGRMDVPEGEKLDRLLAIYGGIKQKSFYERVRNYESKISVRDRILQLVDQIPDERLQIAMVFLQSLASQ